MTRRGFIKSLATVAAVALIPFKAFADPNGIQSHEEHRFDFFGIDLAREPSHLVIIEYSFEIDHATGKLRETGRRFIEHRP